MLKFSNFLLILMAAIAVTGCGSKDKAASKAQTQVVAKVNGSEITVHQVNFALQRFAPQSEAQAKEGSKQVLRSLVEQEMLYQKALETKLDRDPQVVQALEYSRRQYLAQAYMERQIKPIKPSEDDIKAYYKQHPELFEQRRVYRTQDVLATMSEQQQAELQKELEKSKKSLADIAEWLKARNISFKAGNSVHVPEKLPPNLLSRISKLQDGQMGTLSSPDGTLLIHMLGSQVQPATEAQAKPAIERYLVNLNNLAMADAALKKVRDASKIEYLGAYADLGKEPQTAQAKTATPPATSESSPAKAAEKPNAKAMERGLSGL